MLKPTKKPTLIERCKDQWAGIAWILSAFLVWGSFTDAWSARGLPTPATRGWTHAAVGTPLLESRLDTAEDRIARFKEKIRDLDAQMKAIADRAARIVLEERLDVLKDELKKAESWRKDILKQLKRDK